MVAAALIGGTATAAAGAVPSDGPKAAGAPQAVAPYLYNGEVPGQLKNIPLCQETAAEAIDDSGIRLLTLDRERVVQPVHADAAARLRQRAAE